MGRKKDPGKVGPLALKVLLAVLDLGEDAYGVPIHARVKQFMERDVNDGSIYVMLCRLEDEGYLRSTFGQPTAERGGKAKKFYHLTAEGRTAISNAEAEAKSMWQGRWQEGLS